MSSLLRRGQAIDMASKLPWSQCDQFSDPLRTSLTEGSLTLETTEPQISVIKVLVQDWRDLLSSVKLWIHLEIHFGFQIPFLWNQVLVWNQENDAISNFKIRLKTFSFDKAYSL